LIPKQEKQQMKYLKMVVLGMVTAIACSIGASAAFAEGGPLFAYCAQVSSGRYTDNHCLTVGSGTGEAYLLGGPGAATSLRVLASALNLQLLRAPSDPASLIACTNLGLNSGAYLSGGMPGKDSETITYSGCVTPKDPNCEVNSSGKPNGEISTEPLESELVYLTQTGAEELNPDKSGTLFKPANSTEKFVEIELKHPTGDECPISGTIPIKGLAILENDEPLVPQLLKTLLAPATAIKHYFAGMTGKEETIKKLELDTFESVYSGKVSLDVTLLGQSNTLAWWICP
jgi:hypothetical protein